MQVVAGKTHAAAEMNTAGSAHHAWASVHSTGAEFRRITSAEFCKLQVEQAEEFGEGTRAVDLCAGGGDMAVTCQNRRSYVDAYVQHLLVKSVRRQARAFCRGFHKVCGGASRIAWHASCKCSPSILQFQRELHLALLC